MTVTFIGHTWVERNWKSYAQRLLRVTDRMTKIIARTSRDPPHPPWWDLASSRPQPDDPTFLSEPRSRGGVSRRSELFLNPGMERNVDRRMRWSLWNASQGCSKCRISTVPQTHWAKHAFLRCLPLSSPSPIPHTIPKDTGQMVPKYYHE